MREVIDRGFVRPRRHAAGALTIALTCGCCALGGCGAPVESEETAESSDRIYALSTAIWETLDLEVCFEDGGTALEKQWVIDAVTSSWQAQSQLVFHGWGSCRASGGANLRVALADAGGYTKGLGNRLDNVVRGVNLNTWRQRQCRLPTREDCVRSTAVHEFGHALGFAHEHNRPDTPSTCTAAPQGTNGNQTVGTYDAMSVMNYCNPVRNGNGVLSTKDIRGLRTYYGSP